MTMKMSWSLHLRWFLSLQLMLSSLAPAYAQQSPPPSSPASTPASSRIQHIGDFENVFHDIAHAFERANYPNDPITLRSLGGAIQSGELDHLTDRLLAVKADLQRFIESHYGSVVLQTAKQNNEDVRTSEEDVWLTAVYLYFTMAETLERAKLAQTGSIDPLSWSRYDLVLNLNNFSLFEFIMSASLRLRDQERSAFPQVTTRLSRSQKALVFGLNPERSISMYSDYLSQQPSTEGMKKYLAWTAYYGLYENLAKLNQLQRRAADGLSSPSPTAQAQFPLARHLRALAVRNDNRLIHDRQYEVINRILPKITDALSSQNIRFINAEVSKNLLELSSGGGASDESIQEITSQFSQNEDLITSLNLRHLVGLKTSGGVKTLDQWTNFLVDAVVDMKAIFYRYNVVSIGTQSPDVKLKLFSAIDQRAEALRHDPSLIQLVRSEVQTVVSSLDSRQILADQRLELNQALVKKSQSLRNIPSEIDMMAWVTARAAGFPPSTSNLVNNWMQNVAATKSWDEAEAKYESILFAYLSSFQLPKQLEKETSARPLALTQLMTEASHLNWDAERMTKILDLPANVKDRLTHQNAAFQKDLLDWLKIGKALMFDLPRGMTLDNIAQHGSFTAGDRRLYEETYRRNQMMLYPILSSKLTSDLNPIYYAWDSREELWQKLNQGQPANDVIDNHILQLERNILSDLRHIDESYGSPNLADKTVNWVLHKFGMTARSSGWDSIVPEYLVLIQKSSLLAKNIEQRKVLANRFQEMSGTFNDSSDFAKGMSFLNDSANELINVSIVVLLVQFLSSTAVGGKFKALTAATRTLMAFLEPAFGPNATYLQRYVWMWIVGQIGWTGIQAIDQKDQQLNLERFYHSIVSVPQNPDSDSTPADTLAACALSGHCLATADDVYKQSLVTAEYQQEFFIYAGTLAAWMALFQGARLAHKGLKAVGVIRPKEISASIERDFNLLGLTKDQRSFDSGILDSKLRGSLHQLDGQLKQLPAMTDSTARAMTEKAAAAALEQSRLRLEKEILQERKHWEALTESLAPDIRALKLDPRTWWDPETFTRQMMQLKNAARSPSELQEIERHQRMVAGALSRALDRSARDPMYRLILEGAFNRRGLDVEAALKQVQSLTDDRLHISNLVRTSQGQVRVVPGVPDDIVRLAQVMQDQGIVGSKAVRNRRLLDDFVRAVSRHIQWPGVNP